MNDVWIWLCAFAGAMVGSALANILKSWMRECRAAGTEYPLNLRWTRKSLDHACDMPKLTPVPPLPLDSII